MNPEYDDDFVIGPGDAEYDSEHGLADETELTPEEEFSVFYEEELARVGLSLEDVREMTEANASAEIDEGHMDDGLHDAIQFDATRSPDDSGKLDLPFPEVEQEKEPPQAGRRKNPWHRVGLDASHNEPKVVRATRHVANAPEFDDKQNDGSGLEK